MGNVWMELIFAAQQGGVLCKAICGSLKILCKYFLQVIFTLYHVTCTSTPHTQMFHINSHVAIDELNKRLCCIYVFGQNGIVHLE
jgi:hypothetical protein